MPNDAMTTPNMMSVGPNPTPLSQVTGSVQSTPPSIEAQQSTKFDLVMMAVLDGLSFLLRSHGKPVDHKSAQILHDNLKKATGK